VNGSGIIWAVCKSAPRSRQITTPAPHHSVFLQAGCPSCCPTYSVKALKALQKVAQVIGNLTAPGFYRMLMLQALSVLTTQCHVWLVITNVGLLCRWSSGTTAYDASTRSVPRSWQSRQDVSAWHDDASQWQCWDAAVIGHVCRTAIRRSASSRLEILCMPAVSHILAYVVFCFSPFMPWLLTTLVFLVEHSFCECVSVCVCLDNNFWMTTFVLDTCPIPRLCLNVKVIVNNWS